MTPYITPMVALSLLPSPVLRVTLAYDGFTYNLSCPGEKLLCDGDDTYATRFRSVTVLSWASAWPVLSKPFMVADNWSLMAH